MDPRDAIDNKLTKSELRKKAFRGYGEFVRRPSYVVPVAAGIGALGASVIGRIRRKLAERKRRKSLAKREKITGEMQSSYMRRLQNMGVPIVKAQNVVSHAARVWNTGGKITGNDTFMDLVMTVLKTKKHQAKGVML